LTGKLSADGKITPEAEREYRRIITEYFAGQDRPAKTDSITIDELFLRFLNAKKPLLQPSHFWHYKKCTEITLSVYSGLPCGDFSPSKLRTIQAEFIKQRRWTRQYCNSQTKKLKSIFRWGVSQELVPAAVVHELEYVTAIKRGECAAPESKG
jgi:hypothetical protein